MEQSRAQIRFDGLRFDPSDGTLVAEGQEPQTLRPLVARLLEVLLAHPGQVLGRDTLCRQVWGDDRVVDFEAGLSALVKELRHALRALGASDTLLETVPRRGYRLHASPSALEDEGVAASTTAERWSAGRRTFAAVVAAALLIAAFAFWTLLGPAGHRDDRPRMAVIPFEVLAPVGGEFTNLDLVLADTLLAALWKEGLDGVVLLGRTSIGAELTGPERVQFVARELDASLVLEGSLIPHAIDANSSDPVSGGWRIEARLLRLPRGEIEWSATVSGNFSRNDALRTAMATLAKDLAVHWSGILDEH